MATPLFQSVSELTFCLFERPVHPELFDIYGSRRFFQGDYEAQIWITGCSHVVSVFIRGDCLTELICPMDQLLPQRGLLKRFAFRGEKAHQCQWSEGLGYMMNCQVENVSANVYRQTQTELRSAGKKRGMLLAFPQRAKDDLLPLSYVDYEARVDELHIHAFHALPEEQVILKTQSLFRLAELPRGKPAHLRRGKGAD